MGINWPGYVIYLVQEFFSLKSLLGKIQVATIVELGFLNRFLFAFFIVKILNILTELIKSLPV